jgi:lysylphosphatidylglycerol synthetase-like protein (DUF2156 family)
VKTNDLNLWNLAAIACLVAGVVCLFQNRMEALFVMATLGALAWFMNLRRGFQRANATREAAIMDAEDGAEQDG